MNTEHHPPHHPHVAGRLLTILFAMLLVMAMLGQQLVAAQNEDDATNSNAGEAPVLLAPETGTGSNEPVDQQPEPPVTNPPANVPADPAPNDTTGNQANTNDQEQASNDNVNPTATSIAQEQETVQDQGPIDPTQGDSDTPTETAEPEPTARPANTDSLAGVNVLSGVVLQPGTQAQYDYTYYVSTSRIATTFNAGLTGDASGWSISLYADGNGGASSIVATNGTAAGSAISVTVVITAPVAAIRAQTVSFWISATATPEDGSPIETGATTNGPTVSVAPPPTPTPSPTETPSPTATPDSTATPEPTVTRSPTVTPSPSPVDERLICIAPLGPVTAGTTFSITCTIPDATWAMRTGDVTYRVVSGESWLNQGEVAVTEQTFTITAEAPCTVTPDQSLSLDVLVGIDGRDLTATLSLTPQAAANNEPVVTVNSVNFGTSTWDGTAYSPVAGTATLSVTAPEAGCGTGTWQLLASAIEFVNDEATTASFGNGITYNGGSSSTGGIEPVAGSFELTGAPQVIATGTGSGDLTLDLTLQPPAGMPLGEYNGGIDYTISTDP